LITKVKTVPVKLLLKKNYFIIIQTNQL